MRFQRADNERKKNLKLDIFIAPPRNISETILTFQLFQRSQNEENKDVNLMPHPKLRNSAAISSFCLSRSHHIHLHDLAGGFGRFSGFSARSYCADPTCTNVPAS